MSPMLYALGRWCYQHAKRVLLIWLAMLAVVGGLGVGLRGNFDDAFSIPSSQSQDALNKLRMTFPESAGESAMAVVIVPDGKQVSSPEIRKVVEGALDRFRAEPVVDEATSPWNEHIRGMISEDGRAAMVQIGLKDALYGQPEKLNSLLDLAKSIQAELPSGSTVTMGGEAFAVDLPSLSIIEALGVVVALIVLALVLGSLLAAGMPIVTGLIGVALTMSIMLLLTNITSINSVTPLLAVMLGLAVGIDYALFILSRHREQLVDPGISPEESTARSVATAGSAVVFAGTTVVIALLGLGLAQIPFITVMGAFAAVGVVMAVLIALTLLPAFMGFLGERMRPGSRRRQTGSAEGEAVAANQQAPAVEAKERGRFFRAWVKAAVKWPWLTVFLVIGSCLALSFPALNLRLSLPNSGQHPVTATDRIAYDQVTQRFGIGYNGPLIVTADLLPTNDPLGVVDGIKKDVLATPGVKDVLIATPNRNADTGFLQIIPTTGPDDPQTQKLVERLREQAPNWQTRFGVSTAVTGITAVQIDVSERLTEALVPFGIFVVGLSLLLLTLVFRSIAVPIKAVLGYLLSVGVAFGMTSLVFSQGWMKELINLEKAGPVISFLPILLMGILFGLAMDYEVFLVSRIREEYVHGRSASEAVIEGFVGSGKVVAAAAVIMVAVFAFFVPEGMGPIKGIAFALAVGIAVDAFLIRMTLVPAVLTILGDRAWALPKFLDEKMPSFDIEGESLAKQLKLADWPGDGSAIHADGLGVENLLDPTGFAIAPGTVLAVVGNGERSAMMLALAGRLRTTTGKARVVGYLLPDQSAKVRLHTAFVDPLHSDSVERELGHALGRHPGVVFVDNADLLATEADRQAVQALVRSAQRERQLVVLIGGANPDVLNTFNPDQILSFRSENVAH